MPPRRTTSRCVLFGAILVLSWGCTGCGDEDDSRPDLLLITIDSLRADFLECYGGKPGVGRTICGLAREGARFRWAFAPASSSAPSIASLMTSQYPSTHGVDASAASFLPDAAETLAEQLRRGGYATAAFVGSPELNRSRNLRQGFDRYDDRTRRTEPGGLPWRPASDSTDAAIAWIQRTPSPWFVWVHYREPHGPYRVSAPGPGELDSGPAGPGERLPVLPNSTGRGGIPAYQAIPGLFTREGYEARYRREIRGVDAQISRLLGEVEASSRSRGVMITSDHGEAFGRDRYYLSHGHSVAVDQIRVPLVWSRPDAVPEEIGVTVSTLDVMPTLLRLARLATPDSVEGRPLPGGDDPPGAPELARAVFAEHPDSIAVVSGGNFYSRLRVPTVVTVGGVNPEFLSAVAAQTIQFGSTDALPAAETARPSGISPLLEPRVAEFLARESAR